MGFGGVIVQTVKKGIRWLSWTKLCLHKLQGGLGFKKLHEFNLALLCKQGWRLLNSPETLVARLFKAKYYPTHSFLEANLGSNPSFIWRSILAGKDLLKIGLTRRIGSGSDSKIWDCPWLPDSNNTYVETSTSLALSMHN